MTEERDEKHEYFKASMTKFDRLCSYDPRYRPLLIEIGLDQTGLNAMLNEVNQAFFNKREIIEYQIRWLESVYRQINPVKRRNDYRPLTAARRRGKL